MDTRIRNLLLELGRDIARLEREVEGKSRGKKLGLVLKHIRDH